VQLHTHVTSSVRGVSGVIVGVGVVDGGVEEAAQREKDEPD
jgi:hypothetical protein|tara:strand:- start:228 stop:350 length:123 start_codon:yes stop_codon:yes gene_type:complete